MRRLAFAALLTAGCVSTKPVVKPPYYGPTDDLPTVISRINDRNVRLTTLRAEGRFSADLVDPATGKHDVGDGDLTLLYTPPHNLRLVGKVFAQRVFDIGCNDEQYWLILHRQDRIVYGRLDALPQSRAATLPVRPDAIAEVLAVAPLPTDLLGRPTPVLRFSHDDDCYVLSWQVRLRDRWAVEKDVWYDRADLTPRRVLLYDANGRVVLRADLSATAEVEGYAPPLRVPSRYELKFTDSGSTFVLRLDRLEREHGGAPNARSFAFPTKPGVSKVENLDR